MGQIDVDNHNEKYWIWMDPSDLGIFSSSSNVLLVSLADFL